MGKKVVIIGAGSSYFSQNMISDLLWFDDMEIDEIALVDIDLRKLELIEKVARHMVGEAKRKTRITASAERRDVLPGADYVINAVSVGGSARYKKDLDIADKYGVNENVGDILGPTGMFRLIRAYPVVLGICRDMEQLCPDAFFFNYTNPMAACVIALSDAAKISFVGICHNVQSTWIQIADYLKVDRERVTYWCAGINHMDWFLKLRLDGEDAYPLLRKIADDPEEIMACAERETYYNGGRDVVKLYDFVRFEVMKKLGYFPSESPFHLSEYLPYFRKNKQLRKEWLVDNRWHLKHEMSTSDVMFDEFAGILARGENFGITKSIEYVPELIHSMATGKIFRANLNVSNEPGYITNLPRHAAVEIPCFADADGIHPCYIGELPEQLAALNRTNVNEQILMAKAVNEKKKQYIRQALLLDPLSAAQCTMQQICDMADEFIVSHEAEGYMEGWTE